MSIGQDFAKHNRGLATHLEDISKAFDEIEPVFRVLALGVLPASLRNPPAAFDYAAVVTAASVAR